MLHASPLFHQRSVKPENDGNSHIYRKKETSLYMSLSFTPTHPRDARTRVYARERGVGGERVKPEWFLPGRK